MEFDPGNALVEAGLEGNVCWQFPAGKKFELLFTLWDVCNLGDGAYIHSQVDCETFMEI